MGLKAIHALRASPLSTHWSTLLRFMFFSLTLLGFAFAPDIAASQESPKSPIKIAISTEYAPFSVVGPDGNPAGLFIDIWKAWSESSGYPVEFVVSSWPETLENLRTGRVDIHAGLFVNDQRLEWMAFSEPFHNIKTGVFFRAGDEKGVRPLSQVSGQPIGMIGGTAQVGFVQKYYPGSVIVPYETATDLIKELLSGQLAAFVNEVPYSYSELDAMGMRGAVSRSSEDLISNTVHAGVLKDRADLTQIINEGFAAIPKQTLMALDGRWLSDPLDRFYRPIQDRVDLTATEERWLKNNPIIRLAVTDFIRPVDIIDDNGNYSGFNADLIDLLNKKLGTNITPEFHSQWSEVVENTLTGAVHGALSFSRTPEREKHVLYTPPYAYDPVIILTRKENDSIRSFMDLKGLRVSMIKGIAFKHDLLAALGPEGTLVEVDDDTFALRQVADQKFDAHVSNLIFYGNAQRNEYVPDLKIASRRNLEAGALRIAVHKNTPHLFSILNKGLDAISREELANLRARWLAISSQEKRLNTLSDEEALWVNANRDVTVGIMADWPPFNKVGADGISAGISSEIIRAIAFQTGLDIRLVPGAWKDIYPQLVDKKIDALMDVTPKPSRQPLMNFTSNYLAIPHAIIALDSASRFAGEMDLYGRTISLEKGFGNVKWFRENHPQVTVREYTDTRDSLEAVARGEVDAYVGNRAVATFIMQREVMHNLAVHGRLSRPPTILAVGVRKDKPILQSILQKGLDAIPHEQMQSILRTWTGSSELVEAEPALDLTEQEKAWLSAHKSVRVMVGTWPPFHFVEGDEHQGLALDYVRHILDKAGVDIEYVPIKWADALKGISNQEVVDVLPTIARSAEREKLVNITQDYLSFPRVIFASKDDADSINSLEDLYGKTVSVEENFIAQKLLERDHPQIKLLPVATTKDALEAVSFGQADAFVSNLAVGSYLIEKLGLVNLTVVGQTSYKNDIQAIGVRKDWPELESIIDKALAAMTADEHRTLRQRWLANVSDPNQAKRKVPLTAQERVWLNSHPVIRVGNENDWPPFDFAEDGEPLGLSIDIMNTITRKLGVKVEYTNGLTWAELLVLFRAGELDVLPAIYYSQERAASFAFTKPYAINPPVLAVHRKHPELKSLENMSGKKLGIVKGFLAADLVAKAYPEVQIVEIKSVEDGLFKVSTGEVDATFGSLGVISHILETKVIPNVSISLSTGLDIKGTTQLRMAVMQENTILRDILQKCLDSISNEEMRELRSKWISFDEAESTPSQVKPADIVKPESSAGLWMMLVIAVVIFIGLAVFVRILLKSTKGDAVALQMGSKRFRILIVGVLLLLALLVAAVSWLAFNHNKNRIVEVTGVNLDTILSSSVDRLQMWGEEKQNVTIQIGKDPVLVTLTKALLKVSHDKKALQGSGLQQEIREYFRANDKLSGMKGFFIISQDGTNIASMRDENLGDLNLITMQNWTCLNGSCLVNLYSFRRSVPMCRWKESTVVLSYPQRCFLQPRLLTGLAPFMPCWRNALIPAGNFHV